MSACLRRQNEHLTLQTQTSLMSTMTHLTVTRWKGPLWELRSVYELCDSNKTELVEMSSETVFVLTVVSVISAFVVLVVTHSLLGGHYKISYLIDWLIDRSIDWLTDWLQPVLITVRCSWGSRRAGWSGSGWTAWSTRSCRRSGSRWSTWRCRQQRTPWSFRISRIFR